MSTDLVPRDKTPGQPAARWDVWLGALLGAGGLAVAMLRRGSPLDTLITWIILGGVMGGGLAWFADALLLHLPGKGTDRRESN